MPYASNEDLPKGVKGNLPSHGQDIWRSAHNAAMKQYKGSEEKAAAVAWAAVKNKYKKGKDGDWVAKDGTARIQTIDRQQCPRYYELLKAFQARTGVPVLVNTSFNTRGEPIVCTPRDAIECFWTSPLDALVIGSYLLEKPSA